MGLFHISSSTLRQNRDHILVVNQEQDVTSLVLRDILQVSPAHLRDHTVVHSQSKSGVQTVVIRESTHVFLQRCEALLDAIAQEDVFLINRHFCPGPRAP